MKCRNCGFVYDNEDVCPICATPAEKPPVQNAAPFTGYVSPQAPLQKAAQNRTPNELPKHPKPEEPPKKSKKLMVILVCAVCTLSACVLYNTVSSIVLQAVQFDKNQKRDKTIDRVTKVANELLDIYDAHQALGILKSIDNINIDKIKEKYGLGGKSSEDKSGSEIKELSDGAAHKVGEAYQFGSGTVSLKTAAVLNASANFDAEKQQIALTVALTNTTNEEKTYDGIKLEFDDSDFDAENFLYCESSRALSEDSLALKPGETFTAVFCYNMPKAEAQYKCNLSVLATGDGYIAKTAYNLDTKEIK